VYGAVVLSRLRWDEAKGRSLLVDFSSSRVSLSVRSSCTSPALHIPLGFVFYTVDKYHDAFSSIFIMEANGRSGKQAQKLLIALSCPIVRMENKHTEGTDAFRFAAGKEKHFWMRRLSVALHRKREASFLVDVRQREGRVWCADLEWTLTCGGGPAKCVLCRLGCCAQKEADLPIVVRMSLD
jgi:hypothetical protein